MIFKKTLDNGLQLVLEQDTNAKTITCQYTIAVGSLDEIGSYKGDNNFGIYHIIEHMVFKGTDKRNYDDINNDIAAIGGRTNAYTTCSSTNFYISSPAEKWRENLEILSDIVWNASLKDEEFQKERQVIIEELKMYDDDPKERCFEQLSIMMNLNDESRQRIAGTIDSVKKITIEQVREFKKQWYVANNASLFISGNVDFDELVNEVEQLSIPIGNIEERALTYDKEIFNNRLMRSSKNDISQAHFAFAIKGLNVNDPDFIVQELLTDLLGNGFTSILYDIIREQLGLAYTVSVSEYAMRDAAYLYGYCGLDAENIDKAHKVIVQELNKLKRELIPQKRLDILKAEYKGHTLLALETTASKISIHEQNFIFHTNKTIDSILQEVEKVTVEDIRRIARKIFNKKNICFSIVEPRKEV